MKAKFSLSKNSINAKYSMPSNRLSASFSIGGREATNDYLFLYNKPLINGIELIEDKTSLELGLASLEQGLLAQTALQPNDNISELVNNVGYITGITSSDIQTALGYIPYSSENPSDFITISALNGYATEQWVNNQGFIKGISNTDVINALGYTPYDNSNPAGYITSESLPTVNNSTITIQKNGSDIESFNLNQPTNETINITVPTQTSDLTNNSGFITNAVNNLTNYYLKSETYTKTEVQDLISGITGITIEVVSVLPASGENGVIYLVPKEGASPDIYNEYIWVETDADFELIGNTEIDLTNYVQFTDLATVATSGNYEDLSNKPTIPTVGNGTITFTQGGVTKGSITTNQSGNTTIALDAGGTVDQTFDGTSTNAQSGVAIKNAKFIQNTATDDYSLTISGKRHNKNSSINIGWGSYVYEKQATTVGVLSTVGGLRSSAYGARSVADAPYALAMGYYAISEGNSAIQLGYGTNSLANTLSIGFYNNDTTHYNWQLLDGATGLIPDERLSTNIARTSSIGNGTITFTQGGVTKGTITTNQSGDTTIDFDAGGGGGAVDSVNGQTGTVVLTASDVGALADTTTIPSKTSDLTNDSGFITNSALNGYATETWVGQQGYMTGITSSDVTTALGYIPYDSTNPSGYITSSALNGYATETWVVNQGYLTGITSSDVTTALTYTPYNGATNPNGYITSADLPTNNVTTDTAQDISGRKTFLGEKAIYFKQQATSNKLGFTLYNPSNTELGALEYRPNTIGGASLLALNCPQTTGDYIGFRYWGTPAVNIVAPKVATAGNYFIPTHITDGNTTVTASNTGTVNISTLLPDVSNFVTNTSLATTLSDYQPLLESGTNIKTINNQSLLGSGNITIQGGGGTVDQTFDGTSTNAQSGVAIKNAKFIQNTSSNGSDSLTILGSPNNKAGAINIGYNSEASAVNAITIGYLSTSSALRSIVVGASASATDKEAVAIGASSQANSLYSTAIGSTARVGTDSTHSIQLGLGTNNSANTLQVWSYQLLDKTTGLIPDGRLSSNIQRKLTSGTSIKTINNQSLLGSGNISIPTVTVDQTFDGTSQNAQSGVAMQGELSTNYQSKLVSGTNIKTINNQSILGSGNLSISIPTAISDLTDDTSTNPIDKTKSVKDQRDNSSLKYWTGTKAQYDAIATKDDNTIYNVEDSSTLVVDILNSLYPIGAIYIGTMATCPLSVLGIGTWQLVAQDRVLQGAGTRGTVGSEIDESLPNITGAFGTGSQGYLWARSTNGCFINFTTNTRWYGTDSSEVQDRTSGLSFSASNSSSTYQDNAPVQQDGYLVNIWERTA